MARHRPALRAVASLTALVVLAACAASCGGASDEPAARASPGGKGGVTLVAYSTPQVVYDEFIRDFSRTSAGAGVSVSESFGPSGDQSRAVAAGLPADVVTFSLAPDMDRLVRKGLVAPTWADTPAHGMVSRSVVVFVVRRGNPKHIHVWGDLLRPGIDVITPNPATSGSARWNVLAAYGAAGSRGRDRAAGMRYVRHLLTEHVRVQPKSAREALQTFTAGTGDVLLAYENEAITAQRKDQPVEYVVPRRTILIENPIATTTRSRHAAQARAFVRYALSRPAQERFAAWGYRPVEPSVAAEHARRFPRPAGLFTIGDLGGWSAVDAPFFDARDGWVTRIQQREAPAVG